MCESVRNHGAFECHAQATCAVHNRAFRCSIHCLRRMTTTIRTIDSGTARSSAHLGLMWSTVYTLEASKNVSPVSNTDHHETESSAWRWRHTPGISHVWLNGNLHGDFSTETSSASSELSADTAVSVTVAGGDRVGICGSAMNAENWMRHALLSGNPIIKRSPRTVYYRAKRWRRRSRLLMIRQRLSTTHYTDVRWKTPLYTLTERRKTMKGPLTTSR